MVDAHKYRLTRKYNYRGGKTGIYTRAKRAVKRAARNIGILNDPNKIKTGVAYLPDVNAVPDLAHPLVRSKVPADDAKNNKVALVPHDVQVRPKRPDEYEAPHSPYDIHRNINQRRLPIDNVKVDTHLPLSRIRPMTKMAPPESKIKYDEEKLNRGFLSKMGHVADVKLKRFNNTMKNRAIKLYDNFFFPNRAIDKEDIKFLESALYNNYTVDAIRWEYPDISAYNKSVVAEYRRMMAYKQDLAKNYAPSSLFKLRTLKNKGTQQQSPTDLPERTLKERAEFANLNMIERRQLHNRNVEKHNANTRMAKALRGELNRGHHGEAASNEENSPGPRDYNKVAEAKDLISPTLAFNEERRNAANEKADRLKLLKQNAENAEKARVRRNRTLDRLYGKRKRPVTEHHEGDRFIPFVDVSESSSYEAYDDAMLKREAAEAKLRDKTLNEPKVEFGEKGNVIKNKIDADMNNDEDESTERAFERFQNQQILKRNTAANATAAAAATNIGKQYKPPQSTFGRMQFMTNASKHWFKQPKTRRSTMRPREWKPAKPQDLYGKEPKPKPGILEEQGDATALNRDFSYLFPILAVDSNELPTKQITTAVNKNIVEPIGKVYNTVKSKVKSRIPQWTFTGRTDYNSVKPSKDYRRIAPQHFNIKPEAEEAFWNAEREARQKENAQLATARTHNPTPHELTERQYKTNTKWL